MLVKQSPTVSVVIPCYRDAATLARAINSVLAQTYPSIEIVVVNDCSPETERIEAVMKGFPQVRYLRNSENLGLAGTRNEGIRIATGTYVALLDADDEYLPGKIAAQVDAILPRTAVTCGISYVFEDGRRVPGGSTKGDRRVVTESRQNLYRNTLNGAGILVDRELLIEHGAFDQTMRSCEDFDLWLRLLTAGIKVIDLREPMYLYYANPSGLSKNFVNISRWETEAIRRHSVRMGDAWAQSSQFAAVASVWLIRQILRGEVTQDPVLTAQVRENFGLLSDFPLLARFLTLLQRSRLLYLPAKLLRATGKLRNK